MPLHLWMNTPADESGDMRWLPTVARARGRVVLRAKRDAVVMVSACQMDLLPVNGEAAGIRPLTMRRLD